MRRAAALVAAVSLAAAGCGGGGVAPAPPAKPVALLPDLVASPPSHVTVGTVYADGRYRSWVGFDTRVTNLGAGILDIVGHRPADARVMTADQLVHRRGGATLVVHAIGRLRFQGHGHDHWHLLPFDDYELVSADGGGVAIHGHKQGFCIAGISVGLGRPRADLPSVCGDGRPGATSVHERLAVRSADTYGRFLEGQSISLDGVRAGRYYLVLRVNGARRIRERDYSNNTAAALIRIGYRGGPATVQTLQTCLRPPPCAGSAG